LVSRFGGFDCTQFYRWQRRTCGRKALTAGRLFNLSSFAQLSIKKSKTSALSWRDLLFFLFLLEIDQKLARATVFSIAGDS
jgi:hypothetical protein